MKRDIVMPLKKGIQFFLKYWIPAFAGMTVLVMVSACAHQSHLKTPSQIKIDQAKKDAKAARDAKKAKEQEKDSQEVTVPGPQ